MRHVVRAVLPVILLAACDPVRPTSPSSRAPTLRPPSFQQVPSAFASGYIAVDLGGRFSKAVAINDAGQIAGATSEGGALWTNGVRTDLGPINPVALNEAAQVAGNCGSHACLWENGLLTDLGALDWIRLAANRRGVLVSAASGPLGTQAWDIAEALPAAQVYYVQRDPATEGLSVLVLRDGHEAGSFLAPPLDDDTPRLPDILGASSASAILDALDIPATAL